MQVLLAYPGDAIFAQLACPQMASFFVYIVCNQGCFNNFG